MSRRREILIDAYNVMFAHPKIGPIARRNIEQAREEFLPIVVQNRPADATRVVVVFDAHRDPAPTTEPGRRGKDYARGLHIVYATETADEWIKRRIREDRDPRRLTIVTSDREILDTARAHDAGILRVREFLQLPAKRRKRSERLKVDKPAHMSKKERAFFEKLFLERPEED